MKIRMLTLILALAICVCAAGALAEGRTIAPVVREIDVENLPDGVYPVAFDPDDVRPEGDGIMLNVRVYARDVYDSADVDALQVGDVIVVEGEDVEVLTMERDAYGVTVNAEQDARAFYLVWNEEEGGYVVQGMNDLGTYTELGAAALAVAPGASFTDGWDIEKDPVTVAYDDIEEAIRATENDAFVPDNATVRVQDGRVAEIVRAYMP